MANQCWLRSSNKIIGGFKSKLVYSYFQESSYNIVVMHPYIQLFLSIAMFDVISSQLANYGNKIYMIWLAVVVKTLNTLKYSTRYDSYKVFIDTFVSLRLFLTV